MEQGNEQGLEMSAHLTKEELDAIERVGPGWCGDETFQRLCHMARVAQRRVEMSEKLTREQIEDWKSTAFLAAHVMINGEEAVCDFVRLCDLALAALAPAAEPTIGERVERFLNWPLPDSVCADGCATQQGYPHRVGTNLLTAGEARQMLEHVLASPVQPPQAPNEAVASIRWQPEGRHEILWYGRPVSGWVTVYAPSAGTPEERE